tara:strand:- start:753 stop:962 length:210 start_codon:yes stop_codon:yes gene_type:complete
MEQLSKSEKRKIANATYYAKKKEKEGSDYKISYENMKLENQALKLTIKKLKEELESYKNPVVEWSSDED